MTALNTKFILEKTGPMEGTLTLSAQGETVGFASFDLQINDLKVSTFEEIQEEKILLKDATLTWNFELSVSPSFLGKGYARKILAQLETVLAELNRKLGINAGLRAVASAGGKGLTQTNLVEFYGRYGFDLIEDSIGIIIEKDVDFIELSVPVKGDFGFSNFKKVFKAEKKLSKRALEKLEEEREAAAYRKELVDAAWEERKAAFGW